MLVIVSEEHLKISLMLYLMVAELTAHNESSTIKPYCFSSKTSCVQLIGYIQYFLAYQTDISGVLTVLEKSAFSRGYRQTAGT